MARKSAHDERLDQEQQERDDRIDLARVRPQVVRRAPNDRYLDDAHLIAALSDRGASNAGILAWRRVVSRLAPSSGDVAELVARGLGITMTEMARIAAAPLWWDPTDKDLDGVPERIRAHIVGHRTLL